MNRSQMMQAVRSENTKPEMMVRQAIFRAGFRYKLHRHDLPGSPDLFILKYGVVVFINGCFWHQHGCSLRAVPKATPIFGTRNLQTTLVRDIKTSWELSLQGYRIATVWECSIKNDFERTLERLKSFIVGDEESIEI
jgi:DNA mismatch endonuclease Vsr